MARLAKSEATYPMLTFSLSSPTELLLQISCQRALIWYAVNFRFCWHEHSLLSCTISRISYSSSSRTG